MRIIKCLFAFLAVSIAVSLTAFNKHIACQAEAVCDGTDDIPSDVAFASMLLKFGKYFLIVAVILVILFM